MRAQKGHKGCSSAGTDACVGSTVRARIRHVIDRGEGTQSARHLGNKEQRENVRGTVVKGKD